MTRLIHPLHISKLFTLMIMTVGCLTFFYTTAFAQEEPQDETQAITETVWMTEPGVLIVSVTPESAAATAGIVRGDIVLRVGDTEVNDAVALREAISRLAPDETVTVTVLHGDDELELTVTLGNRDGSAFLGVMPYVAQRAGPQIDEEDVTIAEPFRPRRGEHWPSRPFLRPDVPWQEMMEPLTVTFTIAEVITDSPAANGGLQVSDTIVAINGEAPTTPLALTNAVNALAPGDPLTLTVQPTDGAQETVAIELGAHPDDTERAYLGVRFTVQVQIDRQMNGARGERVMPRLHFFLPRWEEYQQWREEFQRRFYGPEHGEESAPDGPMRWRFEQGERNFTLPTPGRFFRWEMPPNEDVIIFRRIAPSIGISVDESVEEQIDLYPIAPNDGMIEALPLNEEVDATILADTV